MRKFLPLAFCLAFIGFSLNVTAQDASDSTSVFEEPTDPGKKKYRQTITRWHDIYDDSSDYNFDARRKISQPQNPAFGSDSMPFHSSKKKSKQQQAYLNREYYFPAKPKNQWELGLFAGLNVASGDVKFDGSKPWRNYGLGASIRKAVGYLFSFRLKYLYAQTHGQDWQPKANSRWNGALNGSYDPSVNYYSNPQLALGGSLNPVTGQDDRDMRNLMWHNFRTRLHELSLQGVLTMGNVKFHRERNRLNIYAFFGIGAMAYDTRVNALDANGEEYSYANVARFFYDINVDPNNDPNNTVKKNKKKETLKMIRGMQDNTYETTAENHSNEERLGKFTLNPIANVGVGLGYHLSKRLTVSAETHVSLTNDDLFDGQRWQENVWDGLTRDYDNLAHTAISLNIHLAKKSVEPLWWLNPMDHTYKRLGEMDPEKMIDDLLQDDDDDGVPNRLDSEPKTPKNCPVDPKGIALDSDKDGCIDCLDKEPFSPPGYPIDENCVAIVPSCCDEFEPVTTSNAIPCQKIELPSVFFKTDKYYISPEYFAHLHSIAERMQMCPDLRVVASGFADKRDNPKYNEQLSWNRVNKTIEYLVDKYGISRDRFVVDFKGESQSQDASSEFEHGMKRKVDFRFAGDGEEGPSNPPAPHPGIKAGSDKY